LRGKAPGAAKSVAPGSSKPLPAVKPAALGTSKASAGAKAAATGTGKPPSGGPAKGRRLPSPARTDEACNTHCWGPSASEGPQKHNLTVFLEYNV
jgi:hypothetical protein